MRHAFADCILDTETLTLHRKGQAVSVEPQVFDLIRLLVENAERVVTRDEIIETVWKGRIVSESAFSARIAAARKAVGDDGKAQTVIRTVARRGLQMVAPVTPGTSAASPPLVPNRTATPRLRYTHSDSGEALAWAANGDGPPVVYCGYSQTDVELDWHCAAFRPLFDALGTRHRLLRYDPIGTGRSDLSLKDVDFGREAEDLRAVADAAGLDRFALFSQSGGCLTAIRFAAQYPDRVTRLVINGGYAQGRSRREDSHGTETIRGLIADGWNKPESSFALAFSLLYLPEGPLQMAEEMVALMRRACPTENMLRFRDAVNDADVTDVLPRIACPTLILHSRHDTVHPLAQAQKLAMGIPGAELAILETANHVPLPGNPVWEDFLALLLDFLPE
ncbi:alpha/beta fold hydrolase [Thetidibacter halocola]|uniref:Alpha/beta fold hydrolase n=1 Tax=Thetidibacter halocola TaxID=2827239 RepID=A0A8J8B6C8_9RHOB|nr:alpha/beta fold hydrolase [Thetidibacter halocola]MBS0123182.1 alpha/beta fold hydrolase [Thetidibacter halocola]